MEREKDKKVILQQRVEIMKNNERHGLTLKQPLGDFCLALQNLSYAAPKVTFGQEVTETRRKNCTQFCTFNDQSTSSPVKNSLVSNSGPFCAAGAKKSTGIRI